MKTRLYVIGLAAICLAGFPPSGSQAQAAATNSRVRTAQTAYNTAQTKLTTAQQAWNKTQQDLNKALTAHQTASNKVHQARLTAAQQHGAEVGMIAAVTERDTASHQISARRDAIEYQLRTHHDYQAAEKETDAARQRLGELSDDKSLTVEQQQKLGSELAAKIRRPTEMRKEAEAKDSEMQQAAQRLQAAGKKIVELQPQLRKAIDSDPAVTKAEQEEKQTALALDKARTASGHAETNVTNAQLALDRQNQNLQAAIAQTRRHR